MVFKHTLFLGLALLLGGCSSLNEGRVQCPRTIIVAEFLKTVEFHQKTPVRVEMDSVKTACTEGENQILMDLQLRFTSIRPLTLLHKSVTITPTYFVAVVDKNGTLLSRSDHEVELVFEEKKQVAVTFQRLLETVPSWDSTVYIGFNLKQDQFKQLQEKRYRKNNDSQAQSYKSSR